MIISVVRDVVFKLHTTVFADIYYSVPHVSGKILGYGSELKRLNVIFEQVSQGCHDSRPILPEITVDEDNLYLKYISATTIACPGETSMTIKFERKLTTSEDVVKYYGFPTLHLNISDSQRRDFGDYYTFREKYGYLRSHLLQLYNLQQEYQKFRELLSLENVVDLKQAYIDRINETVTSFDGKLEEVKNSISDILQTDYVQERIALILQNPFEIEKILDLFQEDWTHFRQILIKCTKLIIQDIIREIITDLGVHDKLCTLENIHEKEIVIYHFGVFSTEDIQHGAEQAWDEYQTSLLLVGKIQDGFYL